MTTTAVEIIVEQLRRKVPGGIGTYCSGLVQGILAADAAAVVRLRASRAASRPDPLERLGLPVAEIALPAAILAELWSFDVPVGFVRSPAAFRGAVVHATSFAAPRPPRRPFTVMVHDLAFRRLPEAYPPRGRAWHERALRRLAAHADAVIVPSELTADDVLSAGLRLSPDRVHVVAEGCDHLPQPDADAAEAVLARLGLTRGAPYLLSVSTLEPRKNLGRLVQAYRLTRARLPEPWPLVVVGPEGWGESGLHDHHGDVLLAGRVEEPVLAALYQGARALCYVPLLEGFGLPAAEAMRAGAAVVASRNLPSSAGAALEVDPLDVESISEGILAAATDGDARDRVLEAGSRRAAQLTWKSAALGHLEVWQSVGA